MTKGRAFAIIASFIIVWTFASPVKHAVGEELAQTTTWEAPQRVPSPEETSSLYPDVAVEASGLIHVFWTELYSEQSQDAVVQTYQVMTASLSGNQWSTFNDLTSLDATNPRASVVGDARSMVHMLFNAAPGMSLYYQTAASEQAFSARGWNGQVPMNDFNRTAWSDLAIQGERLVMAYSDLNTADSECAECADIYVRMSEDGGVLWDAPVAINPTEGNSTLPQVEMDSAGNVYVTWLEGIGRSQGTGQQNGYFMFFDQEENRWNSPVIIERPAPQIASLSVGANGQGDVVLVWRTRDPEYSGIFFAVSPDYGINWSIPQTIVGLESSASQNVDDQYDMETDGQGMIHLVLAAQLADSTGFVDSTDLPGLYHLEWNGDWASPILLYKGARIPEHPRMAIANGNELHVVWSIRDVLSAGLIPSEILYARGRSSAPFVQPEKLPTFTPTVVIVPEVLEADSANTPVPDIEVTVSSVNTDIYSENDEYLVVLYALIPVVILLVVVLLVARNQK